MKRAGLLAMAVLSLALFGCREQEIPAQLPEKEQEEPEKEAVETYTVELSKKLSDFQFAIDGEKKELPSLVKSWEEQGWEAVDGKETKMIEADSYIEGIQLNRNETNLAVDIVNLESEQKEYRDCYVGGVTLAYEKTGSVYQLPGDITVGKSVLKEVIKAYGQPTDEYSEKEDMYITYEFGTYKKAELVFDVEEEILYRVNLQNFREPFSKEEEISEEEPQEVSEYQAPEAITEDILEYVLSYGNAMYEIPAPVSEFEKNGWNIQKDGSDVYVKAGHHGYVTLEKGNAVLYAVVKNYGDQTVPIKYTFVTNVSGDFDVVKVPISIGPGITLGMPEETMSHLLENIPGEKKEEEGKISYYYYSDDTKKNYVRITVDSDLKLIREIELSNCPDSLLGRTEEGEEEGIRESVPLGEGL